MLTKQRLIYKAEVPPSHPLWTLKSLHQTKQSWAWIEVCGETLSNVSLHSTQVTHSRDLLKRCGEPSGHSARERGRICHFTLGGKPSRATIVLHNRQEMVKHIILTHWALWHGQFYCCHRWKGGRKLLLMLPRAGRDKDAVVLYYLSLCISSSLCAVVFLMSPPVSMADVSWVTVVVRRSF